MEALNNWFKERKTNSKFYKLTGKKFKDVKHLKNYCEIYKNINNGMEYTNIDPGLHPNFVVNFDTIFLKNFFNCNKIFYYKNEKKDDLTKIKKFKEKTYYYLKNGYKLDVKINIYKDMDTNEYYFNESKHQCNILDDKYILYTDKYGSETYANLFNIKNEQLCYKIFNLNDYVGEKLNTIIFKIVSNDKECLFVKNKEISIVENGVIKFVKFDYNIEKILNLLKNSIFCYYHSDHIFHKIDLIDGLNHKEANYFNNKEHDIEELLTDYAQEIVNEVFNEDSETKEAPSFIDTTPKVKTKVVETKEKEVMLQPTAPPSIPDPPAYSPIPDAPQHPVFSREHVKVVDLAL